MRGNSVHGKEAANTMWPAVCANASGLIYGFLTTNAASQAVEYGAAHDALAMTTPGDTSMASVRDRPCGCDGCHTVSLRLLKKAGSAGGYLLVRKK